MVCEIRAQKCNGSNILKVMHVLFSFIFSAKHHLSPRHPSVLGMLGFIVEGKQRKAARQYLILTLHGGICSKAVNMGNRALSCIWVSKFTYLPLRGNHQEEEDIGKPLSSWNGLICRACSRQVRSLVHWGTKESPMGPRNTWEAPGLRGGHKTQELSQRMLAKPQDQTEGLLKLQFQHCVWQGTQQLGKGWFSRDPKGCPRLPFPCSSPECTWRRTLHHWSGRKWGKKPSWHV